MLVMVIWALTTLSLLGLGVSQVASSQLRLAQRFEESVVSEGLARAAILHALVRRQGDATPYETVQELRAVQQRELGQGEFSYTLEDEESRLSLNAASQAVLARVPGLGLDGAVAITASTLRPFHVKEELRLLEGITEAMYQQAEALLTVYGSGTVNINTASPDVLQALGLEAGLVDIITAFRAGPDGQAGTADDGVFTKADEIVSSLRSHTGLFAAQEASLLQLVSQGLLGVRSTVFLLHVQTRLHGRPVMTYTIVLDTVQERVWRWSER